MAAVHWSQATALGGSQVNQPMYWQVGHFQAMWETEADSNPSFIGVFSFVAMRAAMRSTAIRPWAGCNKHTTAG